MYRAIYKCRLCNKIFSEGKILSKRDYEEIITSDKFPEEKYFMHDCDEDNVGCADFLGYKKVKFVETKIGRSNNG